MKLSVWDPQNIRGANVNLINIVLIPLQWTIILTFW